VDLTTFSIGSFTVGGNNARPLGATVVGSYFDILGNVKGVGLGTFTATGAVTGSTFNIAAGSATSFSAGRFLNSSLLVGVVLPSPGSILGTPTWDTTDRAIGTFKTTAAFDPTDVRDTASFAGSKVVAANLGTVTLSGVDPDIDPLTSTAATVGIAFRSQGGKVKINGSSTALPAPFALSKFNYLAE
jgi:hypothetical protein